MGERKFSGTTSNEVREYEIRHRELSRKAATEGFVLLQNKNNVLPLETNQKIALYGSGAIKTIKGGTGSGDVNEREVVSIYQGLKKAGFIITTEDWINEYEKEYNAAKEAWRDSIWERAGKQDLMQFFNIYMTTKFNIPVGGNAQKTDTDTAIFVLSRVAGEGADRFAQKGDYYMSDEEEALLDEICRLYEKVIVVLNVGGVVDCACLDRYNISSLILISQPGMESGNAVADVLSGKISPSGKLTDSWAIQYEDYPNQENFSHNNGNCNQEFYNEGIYVGYRYFDTMNKPVRYGFGFGMSYTEFETEVLSVVKQQKEIPSFKANVKVTNVGTKYTGKEVVQVYISCPQKEQEKEYRRLAAYTKTGELAPGQSEVVELTWSIDEMTSYETNTASYVLEKGVYGVFIGNSLAASKLTAGIILDEKAVRSILTNVCVNQNSAFEEIKYDRTYVEQKRNEIEESVCNLITITVARDEIKIEKADYEKADFLADSKEMDFVNELSKEQLIQLVTGDPGKGQGNNLGSAGISVPGSAAETSDCAKEKGLRSLVLADGPAGLRLNKTYQVVDGQIIQTSFLMSLEGGYLYQGEVPTEGETHYQYCTAIPVGTLLAQTWNNELVQEVGAAIGEEMNLFNVSLWLAPGMNIHRNPLCGRNFEYYAEDPFLSGMMTAATTNGVQSVSGCGTTIKHYCCNNQEDNRMGSDSILSERTLREIYTKGFEIAVKHSQPLSVMTSYNMVNGIHVANNYDLCTKLMRCEWNFKGVIMTDWTTTNNGPACTASGCMRAGNDLVMPGMPMDHDNMREELENGTLSIEKLKLAVAHLVHVVWECDK